jgi:formylglycine-generating enzyme required for sulfatase activity
VTHLKDFGWYGENSEHRPQPVALKRGNPFGLFDMHGNVAEWCHDWFDPKTYSEAPRTNPFGPDTGPAHSSRGGSFTDPHGNFCRSAFRLNNTSMRNPHRGFRILCVSVMPSEDNAETGKAGKKKAAK